VPNQCNGCQNDAVNLLGYHLSPTDSTRKAIVLNMSFDNPECTIIHKILREGGIPEQVYEALSAHRDLIATPNSDGNAPLHYVVWHGGNVFLAQMLLDLGANVNGKNTLGYTPLLFAIIQGSDAMVDLLLGRGADVSVINSHGLTYLHLAILHNASWNIKTRLLSENTLDIAARDRAGHDAHSYAQLTNNCALADYIADTKRRRAPAGAGGGGEGAAAHASYKEGEGPATTRDEE
ncbi:MAG: ankyrin repeat domain-containing protein, partial [bacterium]